MVFASAQVMRLFGVGRKANCSPAIFPHSRQYILWAWKCIRTGTFPFGTPRIRRSLTSYAETSWLPQRGHLNSLRSIHRCTVALRRRRMESRASLDSGKVSRLSESTTFALLT